MKPVQRNESRHLGQNEMAGLKGKSGPPGNMNAFKPGWRPDNFASLMRTKTKIYGNAATTMLSSCREQIVR